MPTQVVNIPGLGEVLLAKRRDTRHIKLSVTQRGVARVSMPYWVPYSAGVNFARSRKDWILTQKAKHQPPLIANRTRIGKSLTVVITAHSSATFRAKIEGSYLKVSLPAGSNLSQWQQKLLGSAEKALKKEAYAILVPRTEELARLYNLGFEGVKVRKMTSRWGSCSSKKHITLSYYLVQLPQELIDYVIIHELLHTKHMFHGPKFWRAFEEILPDAKKIKKRVHSYKPALMLSPQPSLISR